MEVEGKKNVVAAERFQPANKTFYETCKGYVIEAFGLLKRYLEKGELIPVDIIEDISIKSQGVWEYPTRRKLDLSVPIFRHWVELEQLTASMNCKQYMLKDETINKHLNRLVGTAHQKQLITPELILNNILYHSFDRTKPFEFNEHLFDSAYARIEDLFYCQNMKLIVSAPLQNFQCELEKIDLTKDLRIVRMSTQELEELWRTSTHSGWLSDSVLHRLAYCMQLDFEKPKILQDPSKEPGENIGEENPGQKARSEFKKVVTALRLFKPGVVGFSVLRTSRVTWLPYFPVSTDLNQKHIEMGTYSLTEAETEAFKVFFEEFLKPQLALATSSFLNLALRRLNYAYERRRQEDKLIDYMIAFESLYLDGDQGEYGYRIAMRAASLLGKNPQERIQIFSDMKKAYRLRSKIVHGAKKIGDKSSVSVQEVSRIEGYLRHSIRQLVKRISCEKHADIIKSLEESLFS